MKKDTKMKGYALFMLFSSIVIASCSNQTIYSMKGHPVIALRGAEASDNDYDDYDYNDSAYEYSDDYDYEDGLSKAEHNFYQAMRKLWSDHGIWTHEWIVSTAADIPNADLVAARLLKNQEDIGNAFVAYYGKEAGAKLTQLLKDHILIATEAVNAAKKGNQEALKLANTKWHENAKEIAAFLSKTNSNWPEQALVDMLNQHLSLTMQQAKAQVKGDWQNAITFYDEIKKQLDGISDELAKGIIMQFPEKFDEAI